MMVLKYRICGNRCGIKIHNNPGKLEQRTDIFVDVVMDTSAWINEACLTKGDKFLGTTAKFGAGWEIIPLRPDLRPEEYST